MVKDDLHDHTVFVTAGSTVYCAACRVAGPTLLLTVPPVPKVIEAAAAMPILGHPLPQKAYTAFLARSLR